MVLRQLIHYTKHPVVHTEAALLKTLHNNSGYVDAGDLGLDSNPQYLTASSKSKSFAVCRTYKP